MSGRVSDQLVLKYTSRYNLVRLTLPWLLGVCPGRRTGLDGDQRVRRSSRGVSEEYEEGGRSYR